MEDEELRVRLAKLIVVALGVGTSKNDFEVINEIFGSFGASLPDSSNHFPSRLLRTGGEAYRARVAKSLSEAAPTAGDLLNEVVCVGGRFIDMVNEVYERLARHVARVGGARAEKFRFRRGSVNEERLTISPAFVERALELQRVIRTIKTGEIDEDALESFLGWDNRFYGRWPPKSGQPLAALMLSRNRARTVGPDPTLASERRLIAAAESLVRVRIARLRMPAAADEEFAEEANGRSSSTVASDYELFSEVGLIGMTVSPGTVTGVDRTSVIGLRADLTPEVVQVPHDRLPSSTPLGLLAAWVAMWRLDLRPEGDERRLAEYMAIGKEADGVWVEEFRTYFDRAAEWLTNEVFTTIGETDVPELVKAIMEFLNLPLWEQRDLLYEIWMLCATLDACEQAGWTAELNGLAQDNREWILPIGRSDTPVATLRHARDPAISLEVWREPSRTTESAKELTPDVTVSTPAPYSRDLLIVEAKDRQKMSVGLGPRRDRAGSEDSGARTAIGVAERYAKGLRPRAVWVCNHCDFRQGVSAEANHGNAWTHIHVADQFRPGHVPGVFAESVRAALTPDPAPAPSGQGAEVRAGGLVVVIDVTSSMRNRLGDAFAVLTRQSSTMPYDQFRAVLYSDHGKDEPLLVRKVGPFNSLPGLLDALKPLPAGSGGDTDEALEDAMQRCRELADDIGPMDLLVLTDAPPHSAGNCPYGIDFESEVRAMLKVGCRIQVASDWWSGGQTWSTFRDIPGFRFARLRTLLS